jgi:hypothetical protein
MSAKAATFVANARLRLILKLDLVASPARKISVLYLQRSRAQYFLTGYPL